MKLLIKPSLMSLAILMTVAGCGDDSPDHVKETLFSCSQYLALNQSSRSDVAEAMAEYRKEWEKYLSEELDRTTPVKVPIGYAETLKAFLDECKVYNEYYVYDWLSKYEETLFEKDGIHPTAEEFLAAAKKSSEVDQMMREIDNMSKEDKEAISNMYFESQKRKGF